jgi:hypothetical protein
MLRFDVLARNPNPFQFLNPAPTAESNQTQQRLNPRWKGETGDTGPIEGRPPGPIWAHQGFNEPRFAPKIAVEATQEGAKTNTVYNPQVGSEFNSGFNPTTPIPLQFHPGLPIQGPNAVWTFNGTVPPKLVIGRYAEPILFRHHNKLPFDVTQHGGLARHTIRTATTARRTTASPGLSSSPASSTTTTGPSSSRDSGPSTPRPPIPGRRRRTTTAAPSGSRGTGARP